MRTHKEKHWAHLGSEPLRLCEESDEEQARL